MATVARDAGQTTAEEHPIQGSGLLLCAAFALMAPDIADRRLVVAAFPYLDAERGLSDTWLGALVSVVSVAVALAAFPAAALTDRRSRVRAIAVMGTVWSLATAAAAAARSYGQLVTARAVVVVGEAGYGPAAGALLATRFPAHRRATVLGAFQSAGPLGAVLGVAGGGLIAARRAGGRGSTRSRSPARTGVALPPIPGLPHAPAGRAAGRMPGAPDSRPWAPDPASRRTPAGPFS